MKRIVTRGALVAIAVIVIGPATRLRAQGAADCRPAPCAGLATTIQAPPAKVIVNVPPPEVVVNQAAPCGTCAAPSQRSCLLHRHQRPTTALVVQPALAAPANFVAAPATFTPVTLAPANFAPANFAPANFAAAAPAMSFISMPVSSASSFSTMTVQPSPAFAVNSMPAFSAVPMPSAPVSFTGPSCQSCGGGGSGSLRDLMSLKVKAQELESRATAALATALRDNVQTHQAALAVLDPSGAKNNPAALTAPPAALTQQVEDLHSRVESLSKSLDATLQVLRQMAQQRKGNEGK
jgi:hypothetical protein